MLGPQVSSNSFTFVRTDSGLEPSTVGPPACKKSQYSLPSISRSLLPLALSKAKGKGWLKARLCCTPPGITSFADSIMRFDFWHFFSKYSSSYSRSAVGLMEYIGSSMRRSSSEIMLLTLGSFIDIMTLFVEDQTKSGRYYGNTERKLAVPLVLYRSNIF
ncbi:Uncharacterised protein [Chlamydia trachomatis]|nr:Uncharacterised protein [Chlamydia trachomatis]